MKQEILCVGCRASTRKLFPTDKPYPGEYVKFVDGAALDDFKCDGCGHDIPIGTNCTAFSAWAVYGGIPYHPWESDFIQIGS